METIKIVEKLRSRQDEEGKVIRMVDVELGSSLEKILNDLKKNDNIKYYDSFLKAVEHYASISKLLECKSEGSIVYPIRDYPIKDVGDYLGYEFNFPFIIKKYVDKWYEGYGLEGETKVFGSAVLNSEIEINIEYLNKHIVLSENKTQPKILDAGSYASHYSRSADVKIKRNIKNIKVINIKGKKNHEELIEKFLVNYLSRELKKFWKDSQCILTRRP